MTQHKKTVFYYIYVCGVCCFVYKASSINLTWAIHPLCTCTNKILHVYFAYEGVNGWKQRKKGTMVGKVDSWNPCWDGSEATVNERQPHRWNPQREGSEIIADERQTGSWGHPSLKYKSIQRALQVACLRAMVIGVSTCGYENYFYMLIALVQCCQIMNKVHKFMNILPRNFYELLQTIMNILWRLVNLIPSFWCVTIRVDWKVGRPSQSTYLHSFGRVDPTAQVQITLHMSVLISEWSWRHGLLDAVGTCNSPSVG